MSKAEKPLPPPLLWTIQDANAAMGCTSPTTYARIHQGLIKAYRVGDRFMLDPESVKAFMFSRPVKPSKPKPVSKVRGAAARRALDKGAASQQGTPAATE